MGLSNVYVGTIRGIRQHRRKQNSSIRTSEFVAYVIVKSFFKIKKKAAFLATLA